MVTTPFELSTVSGDDLAAVRQSFVRSIGFYTLPNLAALAAIDVPAEVKEIVILGARTPGDAGPSMTVRRTNAPVTAHAGWVRSLDRALLSGGSSTSDGGYWEYVSNNQKVYADWFGARANDEATDSLDAIHKACNFITVPGTGASTGGPTVQLGYGIYYISGKIRPTKTVCLEGMGHGLIEGNTRIYVAAGQSAVHADALLTTHGSPSIFRHIAFLSRGAGGQTDKHGFIMEAPCIIEYCTFANFGGHGINVAADINTVPTGTNANVWRVKNCDLLGNEVDGLHVIGGDANAGSSTECNFIGNKRWGLNDESFLGNDHGPHHFSDNGTLEYGGPYRITAPGCSVRGCYTEGGQAPAYIGPGTISIGGFQGSGWTVEGGGVLLGNVFHGGFSINPPTAQLAADKIGLGFRHAANTFYSMSLSGHGWDFRYIGDQGLVLQYDNLAADYAYGITPPEGATFRVPRVPRNEFFIPKRMYLGGGYGLMRQLSFETAAPTYAHYPYYVGDIALNMNGTFAGRMCTSWGINIPTTWTSGTAYQVGVLLRTPGGKTYRCTRLPYDPDAWTMPGSTIMPTHTSGAVAYPEPNPQIDLGEGATIPGYTWLVVDSWYAKFPWQSGYHYGAGGSGIYDATNNRYYQCTAIPTQPTPIFNQAWSMPNSTVEPTHTSGAVEVREPNPSPSGSEPATIPGYVWDYEGNLPQTPTWANFGDFFIDGTLTGLDLPSIADGGRSAVQTMTVTGADIGDLGVTVTPTNVSLQGLEVSAWVDSANTVKFQLHNRTGAAVDLSVANWYGRVRKRAS